MRVLGVLALAALVAAGCGDAGSAPPPAQKSAETPVTVVQPQVRSRTAFLETTAKVQFNEEELVRVNAPLTGRVLEVLARPGQAVEPGYRLMILDSPDLGQAKSDYAKGVSELERSDKAYRLARQLFEIKAGAEKDVREAENDWKRAVAERDRAEARLRTLGVRLAELPAIAARADTATAIVVTAPRSGIIVERNVSPGQVVAYGQSDTPVSLFVIAHLSTMWVVADIYEPDVPKVRLGQKVRVTLPCCPQDRYEGTVTNIGAAIDKDSRTLKVRAVVPNRGSVLKGEMFVKAAIDTGTRQALTVPQSAVQREDGQTFVLLAQGTEGYRRRPVRIGAEFDGVVEVLEGLGTGDRVVSTGAILLGQDTK